MRGSPAERSFIRFGFVDGRLRTAIALNRPKELLIAKKLIGLGAAVTPDQLTDESVDLKGVLRAARGHEDAREPGTRRR